MSELPTRLGERFALGELIGRGTCSEVYRAHDLLLDRDAAVKVFPVAGHPRIDREIALLASLDHPSLVPVYDLGEVDGRAFVVMALFEGGNLSDRLSGGALPRTETLLAVAEVADALAHVHRAGVLHRDVTPRNVLFDGDGRAHLSDFGVAFVADAPRITDTGIVVGSAPYLAPEQVRGEEVGTGADVYALGLVMLEALTGRPPFTGTPLEAARARLERPPGIPGDLGEIGDLLAAMTADDPAARPSAEDVCTGLRRAALADELTGPISDELPVVPLQPRPSAKARTLLVTASVGVSVLLAGTVVFASTRDVQDVSASTPPTAALVPTTTFAPPPAAPGSSSDSDAGSSSSSGPDGSSSGPDGSSSGPDGSSSGPDGSSGSGDSSSGDSSSGDSSSGGSNASPIADAGPEPVQPSTTASVEPSPSSPPASSTSTSSTPAPSSAPSTGPSSTPTEPSSGPTDTPSTSRSTPTDTSTPKSDSSDAPDPTDDGSDGSDGSGEKGLDPVLEALTPLGGALGRDS